MDHGRASVLIDPDIAIENEREAHIAKGPKLLSLERIVDGEPLDPSSPVPLYAQLAARLTSYITGLGPDGVGQMFPSENECIKIFKVSRPTVRQAVSKLHAQ